MWGWWQRLSLIGKLSGVVAAISGAVVSGAAAWPLVEWMIPAHRGYVLEKVAKVQDTTTELLLWKFEDTRNRAEVEINNLNILMKKETDPQVRLLIQKNIDQQRKDQGELDERIKLLRRR